MPTSVTHSPAASYIPHVVMTLSTRSTSAGLSTRSRVRGLTPLFASVAAISARSRHVTSIEHCRKYTSTASSGSSVMTPNDRSMYPIARLRCPVRASES